MAQAEPITTAIRELMSRGRPPKSTSAVRAAHTEFIAALAGNPPPAIHADVGSDDLDSRANHLEMVFAALNVYLTAIIADTAGNVPGAARFDRKYLDRLYADFAHETVSGVRNAAEEMVEHEAWRAS
jgi:hypothetical protein